MTFTDVNYFEVENGAMNGSQSEFTGSPRWARRWLFAAGIYNLFWGLVVIAWPHLLFDISGARRLNYPEIRQRTGMIIGAYGVGYLIAARDSRTHWPIALVGYSESYLAQWDCWWHCCEGRFRRSSVSPS